LVGQLPGHAPSVVLGGTEQGCLLQALAEVRDPRDRRGVRHRLPGLLAMTAAGVLAGSRSFYAVGQWLADASQRTLKQLGAWRHPVTGLYVAPDEATLRRVCGRIDGDAFEQAVGGWLSGRVRRAAAARARRGRRPGKLSRAGKAAGQRASRRGGRRPPLPQVAVDGKVVRGARRGDGKAPHLLGAVTDAGVVLAQQEVGDKTNEVTHFQPLLTPLELAGAVVTADGLHTVRGHARFLREDKQAPLSHPGFVGGRVTWRRLAPGCCGHGSRCPAAVWYGLSAGSVGWPPSFGQGTALPGLWVLRGQ
jgi:hypothetical protein